ncbi:MAG: sigma-70 family RNA polymerase sigma factor [Planctomycetes bacterium]|nr:sigma-70 family RNA polymerase sigma factor [Planctomycetota bacterium]
MSEFERMLRQTHWLRPLARGLVGDEHLAEDVLQDTWTAAWRQPPRDPGARSAWLSQVLRNFVRMQSRGEGRRRQRERLAARLELQSDERPAEAEEIRQEVARALLALDEPFRSTLILRYYEDLSSADIARLEGVPAATVRVRLKRGLDRLREELDGKREDLLPAFLWIAGVDLPCGLRPRDGTSTLGASGDAPAELATRSDAPVRTGMLALVMALFVGVLSWILVRVDDAEGSREWAVGRSSNRDRVAATLGPVASDPGRRDATTSNASGVETSMSAGSSTIARSGRSSTTDEIRLRVVDTLGRPVVGARIAIGRYRAELEQVADGYASAFEFLIAEPCPDLLGYTGPEGSLSVARTQLRDAALAVSAEHYLSARERPTYRGLEGGLYTVVLNPSLETEITVETETGARPPVCTIVVTCRDGDAVYRSIRGAVVRHESCDPVELVSFRADGLAATQDLLASPRHRQRLLPGATTWGTVVDSSGRPVPGATVSMRSTDWRGTPYRVTTDAEGRFETFGLADRGELELEIGHPDYPGVTLRQALPVKSDLGDIAFDEPHRLRGRVVDPNGSPCRDAEVLALPTTRFHSRSVVRARTDTEGGFRLPPVSSGVYVLRVEHADFAPLEQEVTTESPEVPTLRLEGGASIVGSVRTESGRPVAGVPIRIGTIVGDELRGPVALSDAEGHFRCDHLPTGMVRHRPRRRVLRWLALGEDCGIDTPTADLLAESFLPYQLRTAGDVDVPQPQHYGSRNTVAVRAGRELQLIVTEPDPRPPVHFELIDASGARIRAFSNVLIVSPDDWTMKDFAGVDGRPFHLPDPWTLDGAQLTVMSRGYCWQTERIDLRGQSGRVRVRLTPEFEQPPVLVTDSSGQEFLIAPSLSGTTPLAAIPVGATDADGRLELTNTGPGRFALCIPLQPDRLFDGERRRLAMSMDEVRVIGHITVTSIEGQILPIVFDFASRKEEH